MPLIETITTIDITIIAYAVANNNTNFIFVMVFNNFLFVTIVFIVILWTMFSNSYLLLHLFLTKSQHAKKLRSSEEMVVLITIARCYM